MVVSVYDVQLKQTCAVRHAHVAGDVNIATHGVGGLCNRHNSSIITRDTDKTAEMGV